VGIDAAGVSILHPVRVHGIDPDGERRRQKDPKGGVSHPPLAEKGHAANYEVGGFPAFRPAEEPCELVDSRIITTFALL
jgi:hypothetical protein